MGSSAISPAESWCFARQRKARAEARVEAIENQWMSILGLCGFVMFCGCISVYNSLYSFIQNCVKQMRSVKNSYIKCKRWTEDFADSSHQNKS